MYFQAKKYAWSENASKISYKLMHWNTTEIPIKKEEDKMHLRTYFLKKGPHHFWVCRSKNS